MTQAVRIAILLLAGHVAVLAVAAIRVFGAQPTVADTLLIGGYALFVAAATVIVVLRNPMGIRVLAPHETPTFALPHKAPSPATGEISHWIDAAAVDDLEARVARIGSERDRISRVLREVSVSLRREAAQSVEAAPWVLELVEAGTTDQDNPVEESPVAAPPQKADAMVLLKLDPVKAATPDDGDEPDRVVFGSRGRLTSRARVMLQKLGNRLRRDSGD